MVTYWMYSFSFANSESRFMTYTFLRSLYGGRFGRVNFFSVAVCELLLTFREPYEHGRAFSSYRHGRGGTGQLIEHLVGSLFDSCECRGAAETATKGRNRRPSAVHGCRIHDRHSLRSPSLDYHEIQRYCTHSVRLPQTTSPQQVHTSDCFVLEQSLFAEQRE